MAEDWLIPSGKTNFSAQVDLGLTDTSHMEKQLHGVIGLLQQLVQLEVDSQKAVSGATTATKDAVSITAAYSIDQLRAVGASIEAAGQRLVDFVSGLTRELINIGSQFQSARTGMNMVFGDQAEEMFQKTMDTAAKTTLEVLDALKAVTMFGRLGVNAMQTFETASYGAVTGLELINDLVAGSGQTAQNVLYNMNLAIGGSTRNFRALFDGKEKLIKIGDMDAREAFNTAKTVQERYEIIMTSINNLYGGIGAASKGTYSFIVANLKDTLTIIKGLLGERLAKIIAPSLQHVLDFLTEIRNSEESLDAISQGFGTVVESAGKVIEAVTDILRVLADFVLAHPWVVKLALGMSLLGGFSAIALGKVIQLSANLQAFATFVLPNMQKALAALRMSLFTLGPVVLTIGLVAGGMYLAWTQNLGGIQEKVAILGDAFNGLWQLVSSFSGGVMSMDSELAAKLQKAGVLDYVVQLAYKLGHIKEGFQIAFDYAAAHVDDLVRALQPILNALWAFGESMYGIASKAIPELFGQFNVNVSSSASFADQLIAVWQGFVGVLERVAPVVADIIGAFATVYGLYVRFQFGLMQVALWLGKLTFAVSEFVATNLFPYLETIVKALIMIGKVVVLPVRLFMALADVVGKVVNAFSGGTTELDALSVALHLVFGPLELTLWVFEKIVDVLDPFINLLDVAVTSLLDAAVNSDALTGSINLLKEAIGWLLEGPPEEGDEVSGWDIFFGALKDAALGPLTPLLELIDAIETLEEKADIDLDWSDALYATPLAPVMLAGDVADATGLTDYVEGHSSGGTLGEAMASLPTTAPVTEKKADEKVATGVNSLIELTRKMIDQNAEMVASSKDMVEAQKRLTGFSTDSLAINYAQPGTF